MLLLLVIGALANSLNRVTKERAATEADIERHDDQAVPQEAAPEDAGEEPEPAHGEAPSIDEDDEANPLYLAIQASVEGDLTKAEGFFAQHIEEAGEEEERIERRASSLRWLAMTGKPSALQDLVALRAQHPSLAHPLRLLAAHNDIGDLRTAAEIINEHLSEVAEDGQFGLLVLQSEYWLAADEKRRALEVAEEASRRRLRVSTLYSPACRHASRHSPRSRFAPPASCPRWRNTYIPSMTGRDER